MIKIKSSHGCSATSVSPKIGGNKIINHIVTSQVSEQGRFGQHSGLLSDEQNVGQSSVGGVLELFLNIAKECARLPPVNDSAIMYQNIYKKYSHGGSCAVGIGADVDFSEAYLIYTKLWNYELKDIVDFGYANYVDFIIVLDGVKMSSIHVSLSSFNLMTSNIPVDVMVRIRIISITSTIVYGSFSVLIFLFLNEEYDYSITCKVDYRNF